MSLENQPEEESTDAHGVTYFLIFALLCGILLFWIEKNRPEWLFPLKDLVSTTTSKDKPNAERYTKLKAELLAERTRIQARYRQASTDTQRSQLIAEASALLEHMLPEMMKCWLGTPWDFNGTATQPGSKPVACGYFVSTILKDAGFLIDRISLAQQPSQTIICTFLPAHRLRITSREKYNSFTSIISQNYNGINIVGLDKHVGFIVIRGQDIQFIHSSGAKPALVVNQAPENARALILSKYRVVGNLTDYAPTIKKWILNQPFKVGNFAVN